MVDCVVDAEETVVDFIKGLHLDGLILGIVLSKVIKVANCDLEELVVGTKVTFCDLEGLLPLSKVTNCDFTFLASSIESWNMKSSGKRSILRFTAWFKALVSIPYSVAKTPPASYGLLAKG